MAADILQFPRFHLHGAVYPRHERVARAGGDANSRQLPEGEPAMLLGGLGFDAQTCVEGCGDTDVPRPAAVYCAPVLGNNPCNRNDLIMCFGSGEAHSFAVERPNPYVRRQAVGIARFAPASSPPNSCRRRYPAKRADHVTRMDRRAPPWQARWPASSRTGRDGDCVSDRNQYVPVQGSHLEEHP